MSMTPASDVRRRPDGTIDIEFYRERIARSRPAFLGSALGHLAAGPRALWRRMTRMPAARRPPAAGLKNF